MNGSTKAKPVLRESNFELFRIVVMLLIIAHHYVVNSGLAAMDGPIMASPTSLRSLYLLLWGAWGKTGINCFVLLSAYFLCEKGITLRKFLKILLEFMFYRIVIALVFWITRYETFTVAGLLDVLIPLRTLGDGFVEGYLVFFLMIPFLNILTRHMSEKQHIRLLALVTFAYVFLGTFRPFFSVTMNYASWFAVLYLFASCIRLYPHRIFDGAKRWGMIAGVCVLASALSVAACAFVSGKIQKTYFYVYVTDCNTFLAAVTGIALFLFFRNLRIRKSRIINGAASVVFGVFCIHTASDAMRRWLWTDVFRNIEFYSSPVVYLHIIGAVLAVFAVCGVIDAGRAKFLEKPFFSVLDKKLPKLVSAYRNWETKVLRNVKD